MSGAFINIPNQLNPHARKHLLRAADRFAVRSVEKAGGTCLSSSIEFIHSLEEPTKLHLVRWKVRGDSDFCEHWAVGISKHEVIDITRVQVDGKTHVLHTIDSYPSNYSQLKRYPVSVVLQQANQSSSQHSRGTVAHYAQIKFRFNLFRSELANESVYKKLKIMIQGLFSGFRYTWWLLISRLMSRIKARRDLLLDRLIHH